MFAKPLLTEFWRDVVSLGSAIITVVSWLIAIWQIRKTKSAAVAAREAADRAVREGRRGYDRFLVGTAVRYVEGLKDSVDREDWGSTVIRLGDFAALAEQLSQNDPSWKDVAGFLWDFEKLARRKARGIKKPFPTARWEDFLRQIQATIYPDIRPFSEPGSENGP